MTQEVISGVLHPSGKFLYLNLCSQVPNCQKIIYHVDSTGGLASPTALALPQNDTFPSFDSSGRFAYTTVGSAGMLRLSTVDQATGQLTATGELSTVPVGIFAITK